MGKSSIEKREVLIACQALGAAGLGDGIGGHVSRRVVGQEAFWINAFDRTLNEVTESDIFLVDYEETYSMENARLARGLNSIRRSTKDVKKLMQSCIHTDFGVRRSQVSLGH